MKFHKSNDVWLVLPREALATVFDECDGFDQDETGGRVIGTFQEDGRKLVLHITGIIEAGPQARRSAVSFFQDGDHQERIFRELESRNPEIEHLGNWHTHHVNGLQTLSGGDVETYRRTVSHPNQHTPFFYALLVTGKVRTTDPLRRYAVKHYVFRRGDDRVYEIPSKHVHIVNESLVWPSSPAERLHHGQQPCHGQGVSVSRVYDRDILGDLYRGLHAFSSESLGLYWRGPLELADGSRVEIVLLEDSSKDTPSYSVTFRQSPERLKIVGEELARMEFPSARSAAITAERRCNRALYEQRGANQN